MMPPFLITLSSLFILSVFSYSHLNWKEDLFLLIMTGLYLVGLLSRRLTQGLRNYFLLFILIFLLSQFYISNFRPRQMEWWYASIPGWLTLLVAVMGVFSLVSYQRTKADSQSIHTTDSALQDLISKAAPGIVLVSSVMVSLFVFDLTEISLQTKLIPDYSIYIIIPFGFVLFYSLNFSLEYLSSRKMDIFLKPTTLGVLIFLVAVGVMKICIVYGAYNNTLRLRSDEKLWHDLLDVNKTPKIKFIDIQALNELGKISMEKGNFTEAANYYKKTLADRPLNFEANSGVARLAFMQEDWRSARDLYNKLMHLRPEEVDFWSPYIHACIRDQKVDITMEFIRNLVGLHPISLHEPEDYLIVGEAYLREKRLNEASVYLEKAKDTMPQNYQGFLLLGKAYIESERYSDGCEALERATQINPKSAEAYLHLGIAYEHMDQDRKAISAYERAVSIDDKNIEGFYHLRLLYQRIGLQRKAKNAETRIEEIATKVIEAAEWKGRSAENIYQNGEMYWAGKVSAPVLLKEGNATFILEAHGVSARGVWPRMIVDLDGEALGEADVTSAELREYKFAKRVKPGKYHLNVSFTNDELVLSKDGSIIEDRNLFVRRCRITYDE